jgi:ribosome-binding ATPase YchF (GTP1/OBG family)
MKVGIAGLAQSGKTTVFNVLSGREEQTGAFATKTSVAALPVIDTRLDRIWEEYKPPKKIYSSIIIHDLPPGMKETESFATLREMDLLLIVLRAFESESVPYSRPALDPAADAGEFYTRLALSDMQLVEKRLERLEKALRHHSPESDSQLKEQEVLKRILPLMEESRSLSDIEISPEEKKLLRNYGLLTLKPVAYVLNAGEEQAQSPPELKDAVVVFGKLEMEICQLTDNEQETFLKEYCICRSAPEILSQCHKTLNAVTFFTTGDKEVRGWTVTAGTTAQEAAGKIHSDMEKGFIKAEVVSYDRFIEIGTLKEARASAGRLEGRDYIIQDGDIVTIRFNK